MPTSAATQQLAQIMQQLQQAGLMQNAQASQNPFKQTQALGMASNSLQGLLQPQLSQAQSPQPQTLGIQQPIPMALPQADPQGQQAAQPNDPFVGNFA